MLCAAAPEAKAALPAAVTNQPILFVVRNQYQTDHHNTHTMFPSAPNETNTGFYEGGNSALKVFDPVTGSVRTILDAGATGVIRDPEVHFSGTRIVFAWRKSLADCYHIYEIQADGTGLKQLTARPDVDDFDPVYLPDDRIVFVSGREPKYVMCNKHLSHNLYRMDADGANITQIAKSTLFEGHPSLMSDGRLLYDRWEYVDRNFGDAQGLWTSDPEGTEHAVYFGNNTSSPGGMLDAREIPGTQQAVCTFVACHDKPWGAIAVIDRRLARDGASAVVRTWPAGLQSWVKVNATVNGDYDIFASTSPKQEDPFPLADPATGVGGRYFLCSRNTGAGEHMAIYLLDAADGSATLVHDEGSGDVGCFDAMPLTARARPGVVIANRKYDDTPGRFYVMDVYKGTHMAGVARGTVKYLRVVESPEKRYYSSQAWNGQGIEAPGVNWDSFETKRILGTVPVEEDGSAHFLVSPRAFVFFQLLDASGMMVQSMRSGTVIQPGEAQGCVGCHDDRKLAPHPTGARMPAAFMRGPDTLAGWQGAPAKMFNYLAEVQPVFNAKCVSCHDYGGTGAAKVVLAGDKGVCFNASYAELWRKGYTGAVGAGPAAIKQALSWGSHASRLIQALQGTHTNRVTLTAAEFDRVVTWLDLNAVYYPSYASNYPNNAGGRSPLNSAQLSQLVTYTGTNVANADSVKSLGELISFDRPERSPCLSGVVGANYTNALALIRAGQTAFAAAPREDMSNCVLMNATDLWRENKYQTRLCREAMNRAAVAAGSVVYDTQALLAVANGTATNAGPASVAVSGQLVYVPSNGTAAVYVAWGSSDGGGSTSRWEHVASVGTRGTGAFACTLSGVVPGRPCYYRVFAVNAQGEIVSSNVSVSLTDWSTSGPSAYMWSADTAGVVRDGPGAWNTLSANWVGTDGVHVVWCNALGDTAAFGAGGAAGAVTLDAGGLAIGGLLFNAVTNGAYVLAGGPLTLTNAPVFAVNAPALIASPMAGAAGFTKTGAGTLTLSGTNTYGGVTAIEAGAVHLSSSSLPVGSLRLWLDASDPSTLCTNAAGVGAVTVSGQPVGYWGDRSGNGKPATQTTLSRRPTYVTGAEAFNGRPVLHFDGTDDDITSALDINVTNIPNLTVMMVCRQVTVKANGALWGHDNGGWDRLQLLNFGGAGTNSISGNNTSIVVKGMNTNAVLLYTAVLKNGAANGSAVYINGVSDSSAGLPGFTSQENSPYGLASFTLANISTGGVYRGNIQIGEVLVFDTALEEVSRRNMEAYLRNKWLAPADPLSSASLRLRLDASAPSTLFTNATGVGAVTGSGQPVGYWGDLSGGGKPAMQATLSRRPTYVTGAPKFNGLPVLQFDGSDDDITSALDINATNLPNLTVMMVYRQVAKTANGGLWGHDNGGWDRLQLLNFTAGGQYDGYPIATSNDRSPVNGMNTNAVLIYTAVLKNGAANGSSVYVNGRSDGTNGLSDFTSSEGAGLASFTLGNIAPGGSYRGSVQIGEALVYGAALDDSARSNAEAYLRNKWFGGSDAWGVPWPVLPTNGAVRVASGAALDLGGAAQTVASVSGDGVVSNGALTVTDTLAPGGTNRVGVLTLPGSPILSGATLLVDVAADGTGDRLVCTGDLALEGVLLQVANLGLLNSWRTYTLATCAGSLTGSFSSTGLPDDWYVRYDRTPGAGSVTIYRPSHATVFSVR
jgi:autotransporter-associated beta strand protein